MFSYMKKGIKYKLRRKIVKLGKIRFCSLLLSILPFLLISCSSVPITGRKQFNFIPASTMLSMSSQQYGDFLKTNKLSQDQEKTIMGKRVGEKLQKAVVQYYTMNGMADELKDFDWEFNLVENKAINAWCMPGGKVVIYTGILPVTGNETNLAVVVGHELGHAVAKHGSERMSQGLIAQLGGTALSIALKDKPAQTQQVWMSAFGLGAQYGVLLPYSRKQEYEADYLGLIFMAMAGYEPSAAIGFWEKMAQMKGGQSPPEFASTHPSDANRIDEIKKRLPEVMRYKK